MKMPMPFRRDTAAEIKRTTGQVSQVAEAPPASTLGTASVVMSAGRLRIPKARSSSNVPLRRDPERFHIEKSCVAQDLQHLASRLEDRDSNPAKIEIARHRPDTLTTSAASALQCNGIESRFSRARDKGQSGFMLVERRENPSHSIALGSAQGDLGERESSPTETTGIIADAPPRGIEHKLGCRTSRRWLGSWRHQC